MALDCNIERSINMNNMHHYITYMSDYIEKTALIIHVYIHRIQYHRHYSVIIFALYSDIRFNYLDKYECNYFYHHFTIIFSTITYNLCERYSLSQSIIIISKGSETVAADTTTRYSTCSVCNIWNVFFWSLRFVILESHRIEHV